MTSLFRPATNRWWPPATPDFGAYADAGFNLALTGNALGGLCQRRGPNATVTRERLSNSNLNPSPNPSLNPSPSPNQVTHDELFDANVAASDALSALGILTVFNTDNDCNAQLARSPTVAYGNATGGVIEGFVNITSRAAGDGEHWTGQVARSKGTTVPELAYISTELRRPAVDSYPSPNPSPNPGPNPNPDH